jgi:alkylhydroperoxidase family enzyme
MDERMKAEMERCAKHGTPRPESSAVRAHSPQAFWAFADSWQSQFHSGVVDHAIKDLCRVYISRTVKCEFCGNQRSEKATTAGLQEQQYDQLLNFETSDLYDDRQKAALAYAEAIAWGSQDLDGLWARLHTHFSEQELVDHHQYMAGTTASMAPGFETAEELVVSKADPHYWAATSQA